MKSGAAALILTAFLLNSCSMMMLQPPPPAEIGPSNVLVVVEEGKFPVLSGKLSGYADDLSAEGGYGEIYVFPDGGTAAELKEVLKAGLDGFSGAFLVGDLPAALYEQSAFGVHEEFPSDIYFMDLDGSWTDSDGDGIFDGHGSITISRYISRITGTADEISAYFDKLHDYRTGSYPALDGVFIFKDEDWFETFRGSTFGLERLFDKVKISENPNVTLKSDYMDQLSYAGADYVYQWIHSTPTSLYIYDRDHYNPLRYGEIASDQFFKGRFFNMFNCRGARFTETNLAMNYLTGTDSGLAVTGSTKVGGNYYPLEFHRALALGSSWGNAFKSWYNYYGKTSDEWFLGMVILGDPALLIRDISTDRTLNRSSFSQIIPPADDEVEALGRNLTAFEESAATF